MDQKETKYEDGRLYDTGDMVGDLEVTAVQYSEDEEGNHINFVYHTQHPLSIVKTSEHGVQLTPDEALESQALAGESQDGESQ